MTPDSAWNWMVTQIWQIAVLAVVVGLIVRGLAGRHPQLADLLWLVVIIKCVIPPVWTHPMALFSQVRSILQQQEPSSPGSQQVVSISVPSAGSG